MFGVQNDTFAEMFYRYLSEGAALVHINIKTFLRRFAIFWPKKKQPVDEEEEHHQKKTNSIQDFYVKQQEEK